MYIDPFRYARTVSNVKRIYREEASRLHPDRHPKASNSQKKVYTHRFQEMALSYEEAMRRVSDPSYRASEELRRRQHGHTAKEAGSRCWHAHEGNMGYGDPGCYGE